MATPSADDHDVATESGALELVDLAIERYGRLDALINNAGIIKWAGFPEADADNLARHLAVHVGGSFNTTRAAWPHMVERSYGRIVMTTSTGMLGLPTNTSYATAKAAVIGLTRSLATAGAPHGIKVNLIAPAAMTRMAGRGSGDPGTCLRCSSRRWRRFLAHESCRVNGEMYAAGGGRFARMFIASTPGYVHSGQEPTMEDVARNWETINDEAGYYVPADLLDWSSSFMAHLRRRRTPPPTTPPPTAERERRTTLRAGRAAGRRSSRRGAGIGATRRSALRSGRRSSRRPQGR